MSSETAIKIKNLSKCYTVYEHPRDRLKQFIFPRLQRIFRTKVKNYYQEFLALDDVSLEVEKGDTVGVIGRNGSGKSTLLQIVCGTLGASSGSVQINGRVAALLELGSGFNPEFTGIENIYLNAAILGLTKYEIDNCIGEIINFSGLEDKVFQPVKTYSSGMVVRLAFSVTIYVKPDILIIDEALAVGDGAFQLKCMDRMKSLQESGVTVLFVSHDLSAVGRFCNKVHIIDKGRLLPSDTVFNSIRTYEGLLKVNDQEKLKYKKTGSQNPNKKYYLSSEYLPDTIGTQLAILSAVDLYGSSGEAGDCFICGEKITMRLRIISEIEIENVIIGFGIRSTQGIRVIGGNNFFAKKNINFTKGQNNVEVVFNLNVVPGEYFLNVGLVKGGDERIDLDQRWGVRKLVVNSDLQQVGQAFTPIEFRILS